jgi:hypothetical protein
MTEIDARARIRAVLGEADHPPDLSASLAAYLAASGRRRRSTAWPQALVAALLTLLVVAAVGLPRIVHDYARWASRGPTAPAARPTAPAPTPSGALPDADLRVAGLAGAPAAVTSFDQPASDGGYTLTLIGVYADPTRTVIFFHIDPDPGFEPGGLRIADQEGELNASAIGNRGAPGDYVYEFNEGPRAGPDGYAQLTIRVLALTPLGLPKRVDGNWVFTARVRLARAG